MSINTSEELSLDQKGTYRMKRFLFLGLISAVTLIAVACGGNDDGGGTASSDTSGDVVIDGSSTVLPISEAVAEEFQFVAPDVNVSVGVSGTGGGFQKFCAGETDISDASRPIKDSEREACAAAGIEFIELRVGLDGLAVVTSAETDFLPDGITIEQLRTIFEPAAEDTITHWNQVDASWPDEEIQIFAPDTDSGTFDFFTDEVVGEEGVSRADYTASTDDNVLVLGVADGTGTLGYFGYAYYSENSDRLQVLAVDGVTPTEETVSDGSYPLARPLFIYVKLSSLQEKPQVQEFVRFYLSDEAAPLVSEVGYTAISQAELDSSRAALEAAIGG